MISANDILHPTKPTAAAHPAIMSFEVVLDEQPVLKVARQSETCLTSGALALARPQALSAPLPAAVVRVEFHGAAKEQSESSSSGEAADIVYTNGHNVWTASPVTPALAAGAHDIRFMFKIPGSLPATDAGRVQYVLRVAIADAGGAEIASFVEAVRVRRVLAGADGAEDVLPMYGASFLPPPPLYHSMPDAAPPSPHADLPPPGYDFKGKGRARPGQDGCLQGTTFAARPNVRNCINHLTQTGAPAQGNNGNTGGSSWQNDVASPPPRMTPTASQASGAQYPPSLRAVTQPDPVLLAPAPDMDTFFRQRDVLTAYISQMEARIEQIKQLNVRVLQEVNQNNAAKLKAQLDELTQDTSRLLNFARDGVKMLQRSKRGDKASRKAQYNFLLQKLQSTTRTFLQVQNEIKMSKRDQIARQYRIAKPNASEEEIQQAIDSGRTDVFNEVMLSSRIADGQRVLGAVQDRQRELNKVLESLSELQEIMMEMNTLINNQQPFLDEAEESVGNATTDLEAGVRQIDAANKSAIKARRTKWIIFWIVLVVLIIVAIVVAIEVLKNKNG